MAVIKEDKQYFSIVTDIGNAAFANAAMTGTKVNITQFAVGDGNGNPVTPDPAMTGLVHEVWRGKIASAEVDSSRKSTSGAFRNMRASRSRCF